MAIYLGLGSNEGNRIAHLQKAIEFLIQQGFIISRISPIVESPAMLPDGAETSWNKIYLNCVIEGSAQWQPDEALAIIKDIEMHIGRKLSQHRWAPRPIDIDLLLWHEWSYQSENLIIPHVGLSKRSFVLTPLCFLKPDLIVPGLGKTVFELTKSRHVIPLWMGVLNLTPDSFSDGNKWEDENLLADNIDRWLDYNVPIFDLGAESTRPGAVSLDPDIEWQRLKPVLQMIQDRLNDRKIKPLISLDSRHFSTLQKGLQYGVDIVNDVTGLTTPNIISLVRESHCQVVAMHSITVPADHQQLLPIDIPVLDQFRIWLEQRIDCWLDAGLDLNRIVFDPGVGFGKTVLQTIDILKNCAELRKHGLRVLIGHSRKSFMNSFIDQSFVERDIETLGLSLALCRQGVDIIRVHDPVMHVRAYRAWAQVAAR